MNEAVQPKVSFTQKVGASWPSCAVSMNLSISGMGLELVVQRVEMDRIFLP